MGSGRGDEQCRPPCLEHGRIGPEEPEARLTGEEVTEARVADVKVRLGAKLRLDVGQPMLEHREVGRDLELLPQVALVREGAIRAAADEIAEPLALAHHVDADEARRIPHLESAVYVEADQGWHESGPAQRRR